MTEFQFEVNTNAVGVLKVPETQLIEMSEVENFFVQQSLRQMNFWNSCHICDDNVLITFQTFVLAREKGNIEICDFIGFPNL